jgi:MoaD family protein
MLGMVIKVLVEYMLKFRDISGRNAEVVVLDEGSTVNDLITLLSSKYGSEFTQQFLNPSGDEVGGNVLILLNGKSLTTKELNTVLKDGDTITLTFTVFGGD